MSRQRKITSKLLPFTALACLLQMYNIYWYELCGNTVVTWSLTIFTSVIIHYCLHEFIHGYAFPNKNANDLFGMILSLTCGLPIYTILSKGHLLHHFSSKQDDPYNATVFNNIFGKRFNVIYNSDTSLTTNKWFKFNVVLQCIFNYLIVKIVSFHALNFLIICTLLSTACVDTFHEHYYYQTRSTRLRIYNTQDLERHYKQPEIYQPLA